MAMTTVVTGKMYNGKVHAWKDKKKNERSMFRGRLNYRDRTNGEWYFIDAVCWKDFGDSDGLVGFLEKHFAQDSEGAPTEKGGQPIELVGYIEPTVVEQTIELKGKTKTIETKVKVNTFQFVIESVDFPPTTEKRKKSNVVEDDDFDFDEDEEFEVVDPTSDVEDEDDDLLEEEEDEVVETAKQKAARLKAEKEAKAKAEKARKAKAEKARKAKLAKEAEEAEDDDEFFEK